MIQITPDNLKKIIDIHYNNLYKKVDKEFPCFSIYSLEEIIKAEPKKLAEIANWFLTLSLTEKEQFKYITNLYKNFTTKKVKYDAYDLAQSLNVNVCPYCNRNYTFTIKNKHAKSTRPDFDHFYDKDTYPILALSFYNLIPSCMLCNSRLKGTTPFSLETHLHPYQESFNDYAKFKLNIENSSFYYDEKGFDIELKTSDKRAENIKEAFALEVLYNEHKDIVLELIQKAEIYNDSYIDELMQKYEGTLFKNREDLLRLVTCGYVSDKDLHKRPLSKLIKDISEELKLLV
ncbi:MAG: hypothetical protein A2019_06065 [Sulfurimonas sp. GWF2_37_8]|nr:MAG: hypothetical protein A2019_06065 [Sulfurimonas sp. GWF2_37_8]